MVNQTVAAAILMGLFFALIILHLPITFSLCIATGACMIYCKIPLMTLIQNYSASMHATSTKISGERLSPRPRKRAESIL